MVVDKLDSHNQLQVVVVFGNRGTAHTLEVVGLPLEVVVVLLVEGRKGAGLGKLLQQGKVEAYPLGWGKVPWGEDDQRDNPLPVGLEGMILVADCLDKAY